MIQRRAAFGSAHDKLPCPKGPGSDLPPAGVFLQRRTPCPVFFAQSSSLSKYSGGEGAAPPPPRRKALILCAPLGARRSRPPAATARRGHAKDAACGQVDLGIARQLLAAAIRQFGPVLAHGPGPAAITAKGRHVTVRA